MEPIESPPQTSKKAFFNLAGIIPLAGYENEYGTIWPDYLNPIAVNYYPFHKSVMECAFAGCDTIWIVGNYDYIGIVKKLLGEHVIDPAMYECWYINKSGKKVYKRKIIPIMYIGRELKVYSSEQKRKVYQPYYDFIQQNGDQFPKELIEKFEWLY